MKIISSALLTYICMFLLSASFPAQRAPVDTSGSNMPMPRPNRGLAPVRPMVIADSSAGEIERPFEENRQPVANLRKEVRERLKITDEEKANSKKAFNDSKANVFRLLSAFSCSTSLIVDLSDPRCSENPNFVEGSYYSFRYKNYGQSPWTDMNLTEGELTVGNKFNTVGLIVDLGDGADPAKFDESSPQVKSLWGVPSAETLAEKIEQKAKLEKGFAYEEVFVSSKTKLLADHTYLLRTISYRVDGGFATFRSAFNWYNTDSLFVFKVAAVDETGTATIAWKRLMQRVAPLLTEKDKDKDKEKEK